MAAHGGYIHFIQKLKAVAQAGYKYYAKLM
jgi:hypothetical protein